jgi:hypothetical protein
MVSAHWPVAGMRSIRHCDAIVNPIMLCASTFRHVSWIMFIIHEMRSPCRWPSTSAVGKCCDQVRGVRRRPLRRPHARGRGYAETRNTRRDQHTLLLGGRTLYEYLHMDDDAKLSLAEHATREDAHVGQVLTTAKLVTTFSAAFAATFLAAALQVGRPTSLDYVAASAMLAALLITVGIATVRKATLKPTDFTERDVASAHGRFIANVPKNLHRARWVHRAMIVQLIFSSITSLLAVVEIFLWLNKHPPPP